MSDALLFDLPDLPPPKRPPGPIVRAAEFSDETWGEPGLYRWTLSRRWSSGPLCLFCGCNPSDANGLVDDMTIGREIGFAFRWGFGGMVKINVEPLVSSKMGPLREWQDSDLPGVHLARTENAKRAAAVMKLAEMRVAVWGDLLKPTHVGEFLDYLEKEAGGPVKWHCIAKNPSGSPKHPMARGKSWVPDNVTPQPWSRPGG